MKRYIIAFFLLLTLCACTQQGAGKSIKHAIPKPKLSSISESASSVIENSSAEEPEQAEVNDYSIFYNRFDLTKKNIMQPVVMLIGIATIMFTVIGGLSLLAHYYTLNGIKSRTVGDGQHGTAPAA